MYNLYIHILYGHQPQLKPISLLKIRTLKVVFGKELPQKNMVECLFRYILQDTIFCKMANCTILYVVLRLILSQFFIYCPWFSRNSSFPVQLPLQLLEKNLQLHNIALILTTLHVHIVCTMQCTPNISARFLGIKFIRQYRTERWVDG